MTYPTTPPSAEIAALVVRLSETATRKAVDGNLIKHHGKLIRLKQNVDSSDSLEGQAASMLIRLSVALREATETAVQRERKSIETILSFAHTELMRASNYYAATGDKAGSRSFDAAISNIRAVIRARSEEPLP